jgi:hypothetical protein
MTLLRSKAQDARGLVALCFVIGTTGCAANLAPANATNQPPPGVPTSAAAYDSAIALYPRTGTPRVRDRCPDSWICFKNEIHVSIQPLGTTSEIDPTAGLAKAVPVAHLINLDKKKNEKYYGLLPRDSAEYDLWVNQKPGSTDLEWRIVGKIKATNQLVYGQPTDLLPCHLYRPRTGATDADFAADKVRELGDCKPLETAASSSKTSSLSFSWTLGWIHSLQMLLTSSRTGGGWIECSSGCCT